MLQLRSANARGKAYHGWLDSQHTFSFAGYYDPAYMGYSVLRVINDDRVAPGAGFDTHGHKDMEIISYVISGAIEHKDSEGNRQTLPAGEFQLMSAGSGIYHSEYNPSDKEPLRFLQIWIRPDRTGGQPGYQQKDFGKNQGLTLIASPEGSEDSLRIRQNATLSQLVLSEHSKTSQDIRPGSKVYLHLVEGKLDVRTASGEDQAGLEPGDGLMIADEAGLEFINSGDDRVLALVFDLP